LQEVGKAEGAEEAVVTFVFSQERRKADKELQHHMHIRNASTPPQRAAVLQ
jgi:hypothetical protein